MRHPFIFLRDCDNCEEPNTRLFTDTWTGKELCIECIAPIIDHITMSPEEGDNLPKLLNESDRKVEA